MDAIEKADPLSSVEDYSPKDRADAYDLFLNRAMSLDDVAIVKGLDQSVVAGWAKQGKWVARKKAILEDMNRSIEQKFHNWAIENKIKVAENHLNYGQEIEKTINEILKQLKENGGKVTTTEIMRLSKALAEVSNVSARAVGLDTEGAGPAQIQQHNQKQPLIIIGLKPVKEEGGTTLEAEYKESEV
jgi:hypothetical protein